MSEYPDRYDDVPPSLSVDMPPTGGGATSPVRPALGAATSDGPTSGREIADPAAEPVAAGPASEPDGEPAPMEPVTAGPAPEPDSEPTVDGPAGPVAAEPAAGRSLGPDGEPGPMEPVAAGPAPEPDSEPTVDGPAGGPVGSDAPAAGPVDRGADRAELTDPDRLRAAIEAVLLVVDVPTSATVLAQVLGRSVAEVDQALRFLREEYDSGGRGLDLREVAEGWRLYSRDDFAAYVERFVLDGQQARLTQAALETLAVVAYRQPVTRSRVSAIRGVSVDAVMRTLLTRGLVEECGADPDTGGGLYRTTRLFLEKLGLRSLDELPSLAPLLPDTSQLDDVAVST